MELDATTCYRALRTRDARFDGRFFTAVRSTGIYCRPICPARTPRRHNCLFLPSAAAAQEAGFRPCLRCRPEAAPGTPAWLGTCTSVSRALRLIENGALDHDSVGALAARLGLGERHLRRLFLRHVGASPLAVAQTRRVLFAKRLLDETGLPMAQVALGAGFSSVRRFNDALRSAYGRPPRVLREARRGAAPDASALVLRLPYRAPLHWEALVGFLSLRATPGVEHVAAGVYQRSVRLGDARGLIDVRPVPGESQLEVRLHLSSPGALIQVAQRVRRLFDLGADPREIEAQLGHDPCLGPAVRRMRGLRVPGAWDGFELAVRAVLGQQVSVRGATTLAGRLVRAHGEPLDAAVRPLPVSPDADRRKARPSTTERTLEERTRAERRGAGDAPSHLFPRPEVLARADLTRIGLPRTRARALAALAGAVAAGELDLDGGGASEQTRAALCALPGIGAWTAAYIAMRALGEPDAFPASDLGLRRALAAGGPLPSVRELERRAEAWRPWRAYAALWLWSTASAAGSRRVGARRAYETRRAAVTASRATASRSSRLRLRSAPQR